MDWRSLNFDWNHARAFLLTAEEGSLSAAARALGLTQPTLGRQVDAMEAELGLALFERIGRGLVLTPAGSELVKHVQAMGEAARGLSMAAFGQNEGMAGLVSITVSEADAAIVLPPILAELRAAEPDIVVEIIASSGTSDLLLREADIAIRNFRPREPELIARKVRDGKARLYATPSYLARKGPIETLADLNRLDFISLDRTGRLMQALNTKGLALTTDRFPFQTENFIVMLALVRQSLGVGILDERMGDIDPMLQRALPSFEPFDFPIWLVAHRDIHKNRRLRFVFDFLAEALK